MDFVAIDFETATSNPGSVCSLGLCVVENNKVVKTAEYLRKPMPFEFNEYNIKIHGITPEMVFCMPCFDAYWEEIKPYIENKLVIAHNAPFDVSALKKALSTFSIEYPCFTYLCTVELSRKAYPDLPGHKLNELADTFGVKFSHHNAEDDAYACAMILLQIIKDFNIEKVEDLNEHFGISPSAVYPGCDQDKKKTKPKRRKPPCA